jgi:hypothetical protein
LTLSPFYSASRSGLGWLVGFRYQGRARTDISSNPFALLRNAVGVFRRGFGVVDTLGMLEFCVLECWNGSGLLTLEEVRFANGSTLSLEVLPTQALGRTGWLRPLRRDREAFGVPTGRLGMLEFRVLECLE